MCLSLLFQTGRAELHPGAGAKELVEMAKVELLDPFGPELIGYIQRCSAWRGKVVQSEEKQAGEAGAPMGRGRRYETGSHESPKVAVAFGQAGMTSERSNE